MIRVLGIGSPWGDDAVGWEVGQAIAAEKLDGVEVRLLDRPGIGLLDHLTEVEEAILVDAILAEGDVVPGTLVEADLSQLTFRLAGGASTHGLGVGEAIEVARSLGTLPPRCRLVAIAIAPASPGAPSFQAAPTHDEPPERNLDVTIQAAIEPACASVRRWLRTWREKPLTKD